MSAFQEQIRMNGSLGIKPSWETVSAPLGWKVRNALRREFLMGWLWYHLAGLFSKVSGIVTMRPVLRAVKIEAGTNRRVDYGIVALGKVVTTVFVNEMVDQMQTEDSTWGDFKFHDSGVGTTGAAVGDTDIETTDSESRATGTQTEGASANIYRSVGTISYTSTLAITEHGLFNASTSGELLDRHVFSAINVVNGDSIQFTYELTVSAGG